MEMGNYNLARKAQGKDLLGLFNRSLSEPCGILETEKFVQCREFSQRNHLGEGDKMGRGNSPETCFMTQLSILGIFFQG